MQTELNRITNLLHETADGNNWTGINMQQALHDISPELAVQRINSRHLNIAELVAHLTCWNRVITNRLDKQNHQPEKEEDFPEINKLSATQWDDLKLEFFRSYHLLRGKLENKEDIIINEPIFEGASSTYRNLHGQVAHIQYHMGQIVLLKKIL